jgi:hypothetical protein
VRVGIHYEKLLAAIDQDNSEEEIHRLLAADPLRKVFPALLGWSAAESEVVSKPGCTRPSPISRSVAW